MSLSLRTLFTRALAVLSLTLPIAFAASADPGPHGPGQPYCQHPGHPHGWGSPYCPHGHGPAAMPGKSLGVLVSDLPNAMLDAAGLDYGVSVERVKPGSAAEAAGIQAGDVIVAFAGKPVISAERLRWLVRKTEAGKAVEIKLLRQGQPVTVSATLSEAEPGQRCAAKPGQST